MIKRDRKEGDFDLVCKCRQGSVAAWEEFYTAHANLVRNVVRKQWWVRDHEVEDLVQSSFESLIESMDGFTREGSLAAFVFVVTERVCLQEMRRRFAAKRDVRSEKVDYGDCESGGLSVADANFDSPEEILMKRQIQFLLEKALSSLREKCKGLLRLRYFDGLSYRDIAEAFGERENTLHVRAKRCLEELASKFQELTQKEKVA
ncbi:MAG: sigma-70 family RNA polymerase sigma factor [Spirochaetia bacterium]|nr:sigma-70 family RNA polymerase sigma factor [Spirochaetia bacterium]